MKKAEVEVGKTYIVMVSRQLVPVKLIEKSKYGGWIGVNQITKREVRIKTAAKLRKECTPEVAERYAQLRQRQLDRQKEAQQQ